MTPARIIAGVLAAAGVLAGLAARGPAQPSPASTQPAATGGASTQPALPNTKPSSRVMDCTNGGCHAEQVQHKFLHGPVAVQACDACHNYADPAAHAFTLKREGRQLCEFCHIDKSGTEGPTVHKPVADGQCTECHDPHGSESRRMLKKGTESDLCTSCHKDVVHGKFVHGPVWSSCTSCHKAHVSSHPKLLSTDARSLCLTCHTDVGKTVANAAHPHAPATGDCLDCHDAHASDHAKVLTQAPRELCSSCHQEVGKEAAAAKHPHSAMSDDRACLNCHVPHGSNNAKQLPGETTTACLQCHREPITVEGGRVVPGVPELENESFHKHGPIGKGECAACHDVHGAHHRNLLVEPYPEGFYQPYADKTYALCFKCHDREGIVNTSVDHQTRFRDGDRNLHALHVNKTPQGRSCRACHNVHASTNESLLAETVSFGEWQLPVGFKKTETGGSCAPGCHKPASYDRGPDGGRSPLLPAPTGTPAPTEPAGGAPAPAPAAAPAR